MYFVMPSKYSLSILPKPNNAILIFRKLPESRSAVIRFSGLVSEEKVAKKLLNCLLGLKVKTIRR
jgi:hypothetical protein